MMRNFWLLFLTVIAFSQAVNWNKVHPKYHERPPFYRRSSDYQYGSQASHGQFRYQVGLVLDKMGFCSGLLIKDDFVLTTAQCASGVKEFEVHLAAQKIFVEDEPFRQIVLTSEVKIHELWSTDPTNHDLAVLRLPFAVSGDNIGTIRLPSYNNVSSTYEGELTRVSGWGRSALPAYQSRVNYLNPEMLYDFGRVISNTECAGIFGSFVTPNHVCVTGDAYGLCSGDPGSPMVVDENDGQFTLLGIASFGSLEGCDFNPPVIFTRLTSHLDWLVENTGVTVRPAKSSASRSLSRRGKFTK